MQVQVRKSSARATSSHHLLPSVHLLQHLSKYARLTVVSCVVGQCDVVRQFWVTLHPSTLGRPKTHGCKKTRKKLITINEIWTLKIRTAWRRNVPSWSQSSYYFSITMGWAVDSCGVSHEDRTKCNYFDSNLLWTAFKVAESIPLVNTLSRAFKWFLAAAPVIKLNQPCCIRAVLWRQVKAGGTCSLSADIWDDVQRHNLSHYVPAHFQGKASAWWQRFPQLPPQNEGSWAFYLIFRQPLAISANSAAIQRHISNGRKKSHHIHKQAVEVENVWWEEG